MDFKLEKIKKQARYIRFFLFNRDSFEKNVFFFKDPRTGAIEIRYAPNDVLQRVSSPYVRHRGVYKDSTGITFYIGTAFITDDNGVPMLVSFTDNTDAFNQKAEVYINPRFLCKEYCSFGPKLYALIAQSAYLNDTKYILGYPERYIYSIDIKVMDTLSIIPSRDIDIILKYTACATKENLLTLQASFCNTHEQ